jgi:putative heme-binding domain-containing protein
VKFYGAAETDMGLVTAACAPHIYRGGQFPPEYRGAHFSCECAYNLIHLCRLEQSGAGYQAIRAIENGEFLTSSEQWFRPVNLAGGPDGALYIVDMYREIIEDYSAIPRYLQQQYGLIAGLDRGRIWRVMHEVGNRGSGSPRPSSRWDFERLKTTSSLLGELSSSNAWRRLTAQRLIVERADRSVAPELRRLLTQGTTSWARLHALHTLAGLQALEPGSITAALDDASPGVRRHALHLSDGWLDQQPALLTKLLAMTNDADPKVRIQLAFSLGETRDARRLPALAALASQFGDDRWMQAAIVSSVPDAAEALLRELVKPPGLSSAGRQLSPSLVTVLGARQQPSEIARLLQLLAGYAGRAAESFQAECLGRLNESLKRGKPLQVTDPAGVEALRQLLSNAAPSVRRAALQVAGTLNLAQSPELLAMFEQAARTARNVDLPLPERQSAIALLASAPFEVLQSDAISLLAANQPLDLQLATVNALGVSDNTNVVTVLLSGWKAYSPKMQSAVLDALFKRQERIKAFLRAIQQNTIPPPGLDPLRQDQLRANPDAEIRRLAEPILARQTPGLDRQASPARFQTALSAPRDAAKGKELFQVHCSACHLLEGVGKSTGPELIAATKGRADETILLDILQPSDQITVGFRTYNVVTTGGHNLSGILAAETATSVTLPDEDGLPQTVLRKDIVSFQASEVSLMPANFAELLAPQDVADLLGYLRRLAGPPPGPVMTLFDDDPAFVEQLKEGNGTASLVTNETHHGSAALMITPPQRFATVIPGWQYRIVEKPGPGEYRYLRFAWKSPVGTGVMLELADQGQWPPPDRPLRRYVAGQNSTGWQARQQAVDPPREWAEIVVDLWMDFGPFTLTGLAPTAMGGPAYFDRIELSRERSDLPMTFPKQGALPARYPPDEKVQSEPAEKDYYLFSSPCRSLAQIATIRKDMPHGQFAPPPADWRHLKRTRRILTEGGELRVMAVGDSIVNDTMRSGWVALLQDAYPKANIQATVFVRGGGGCQHYQDEGRVAKYILRRKPDLVFIGGISQKDIASIREVIRQLRAGLPEVEILLATGAFGAVDPRDAVALARAPCSGTGDYGRALKALATELSCAYLDLTTPWAEYLRSAGVHPHLFHRDVVHANEFGEQVLAKIMMAFWTAPESAASAAEGGGQSSAPARLAYAPAPPDNPLKGFVPYLRADPTFPHSLEWDYTKLSEVMAGPTNFNWAPFEAKLNAAASRGHQFFARFYLEWPGKTTGVPQYLLDAGLTLRRWTNTNTQPFPPAVDHTPNYEDPRLRAALTNFIHALGRRYDGDPRLGFVGLGLLGTWGEWHNHPHSEWFASKTVQREVMEAYEAAFKRTKLVARYPAGTNDACYADNSTRAIGYHDDSFAWATVHTGKKSDNWFFETRLRDAGALDKWRAEPIGGEVRPEVWKCLFDEPSCVPKGQEFDRCVAVTHASWLCNEGVFRGKIQGAARERAVRAVQRLGYELHVASAASTVANGQLHVALTVTNTGVAPFYYNWPVELGALDASGKIAATWKPEWELSSIQPAHPPVVWSFTADASFLKPGLYRLLLRVPNPLPNGRPLRFANQSQDQHGPGWLTLGGFRP